MAPHVSNTFYQTSLLLYNSLHRWRGWYVFHLSTFLESQDHTISLCLVPSYHLIPEHPFIWINAFIPALRGPRELNPGHQLSKHALYPLHHRHSGLSLILKKSSFYRVKERIFLILFLNGVGKPQNSRLLCPKKQWESLRRPSLERNFENFA